jgi:hypothetical protein
MVMKNNVKWRMCIDFTDLNKCYPKDDFPLSRIDKVVDLAAQCETMTLLDCFSVYYQIWLAKEDEEKTSFITLILYVLATHTAVSGALIQERERLKADKKLSHQVPIYLVSEALAGSKKYYSEMEKICYAVIMSARKLRHYFKAHGVSVLMSQPLNDIFGNHDSSGRIGKWAMELL